MSANGVWVQETWESEEDVIRDLLVLSEYPGRPPRDTDSDSNKLPESILNYNRQMELNRQKPLNSDIDDNASYVVSGRGRGIKDRVIRPGGIVDTHPLDDIELKKQIRQVAGLGYSNEFIEQSIKAKYNLQQDIEPNSKFKLVSIGSSSSHSSVEVSPTKSKKINVDQNNGTFSEEDFPPLS